MYLSTKSCNVLTSQFSLFFVKNETTHHKVELNSSNSVKNYCVYTCYVYEINSFEVTTLYRNRYLMICLSISTFMSTTANALLIFRTPLLLVVVFVDRINEGGTSGGT